MAEPRVIQSPWPNIVIPNISLQKFLLQRIEKNSDQYITECESNMTCTYYKLLEDIKVIANAWKYLGLKEGDIFGVCGYNCYEYLVLYLGGIIAGGIASGMSDSDTFREVADKIIQRKIRFLAITNKNIQIARKIADGIPITEKIILFNGGSKLSNKYELYSDLIDSFDQISDDQISIPNEVTQDVCMMISSSGTFAPPKAVMLTHYSLVSALTISSLPAMFSLTQFDIISSHSQFSHQNSIFQTLLGLTIGSRLAIMPRFDYANFIKYVQKFKITYAILPPSVIISLTRDPNKPDIPSLIKVICSDSLLPRGIGQQFVTRFDHIKEFRQGLFTSETVCPISFTIKGSTEYDCLGVAVPNTRIKVIDTQNGQQLGHNQHGEICVSRPDAICKGYFNNIEATRRLIDEENWLHTGLIGYFDEDGYIYVMERMEELIPTKAGGFASPAELESLLLTHDAVQQATVVAIPLSGNENHGRDFIAAAFVILKANYVSNNNNQIRGYEIEEYVNGIADSDMTSMFKSGIYVKDMSSFVYVLDQLPKKRRLAGGVHIVNKFPLTSDGNVIRRQLRDDLMFRIVRRKF